MVMMYVRERAIAAFDGGWGTAYLRLETWTGKNTVSTFHSLLKTMHTALGEPCLLGYASPALATVDTKALAKPQAFVTQSHVQEAAYGCRR
jgi:hypothetical protein